MKRIEKIRETVDGILLKMPDDNERRCAYVHMYGVAQACALLAAKRRENTELVVAAGMLHDIYSCANMDWTDHAHKGAEMARRILDESQLFSKEETDLICTAIYNHSDKAQVHGSLDELLKDADVLQHALYAPLSDVKPHERSRYAALVKELGL